MVSKFLFLVVLHQHLSASSTKVFVYVKWASIYVNWSGATLHCLIYIWSNSTHSLMLWMLWQVPFLKLHGETIQMLSTAITAIMVLGSLCCGMCICQESSCR